MNLSQYKLICREFSSVLRFKRFFFFSFETRENLLWFELRGGFFLSCWVEIVKVFLLSFTLSWLDVYSRLTFGLFSETEFLFVLSRFLGWFVMDLAVISPVVFRLEFIDICFGCCCVDYVGYLNLDLARFFRWCFGWQTYRSISINAQVLARLTSLADALLLEFEEYWSLVLVWFRISFLICIRSDGR